jgi:hypothetical protein
MATGEPTAAPVADNEELTEFVNALKKEVGDATSWHVVCVFLQSVCMYSFLARLVAARTIDDTSSLVAAAACVAYVVVQWDRIEDKYAVTTLAVAATLAMWSAGGVVSVLDLFILFD